jgi:hypothetical protein
VVRGKIVGNDLLAPLRPGCGRFGGIDQRLYGQAHGLLDDLILRFEVFIESAMRQARRGHEVCQPGTVDAFLPKFDRRRLYDALPRLCCFLPGFSHCLSADVLSIELNSSPDEIQHLNGNRRSRSVEREASLKDQGTGVNRVKRGNRSG